MVSYFNIFIPLKEYSKYSPNLTFRWKYNDKLSLIVRWLRTTINMCEKEIIICRNYDLSCLYAQRGVSKWYADKKFPDK